MDASEKKLRVIRLSPELSELIAEHAYYPPDGSTPYVAFDPVDRRRWLTCVDRTMKNVQQLGYLPIILCVTQIRQLVYQSLEREMPGIVVLLLGSLNVIIFIIGLLLMTLGGVFALIGGIKYYIDLSKFIED